MLAIIIVASAFSCSRRGKKFQDSLIGNFTEMIKISTIYRELLGYINYCEHQSLLLIVNNLNFIHTASAASLQKVVRPILQGE